MTFRIAQLGSDDLAAIRALNRLFGEAFNERETFERAPPGDDYLRRLLAKPHICVLAALAGDEVVGGLVAYELEKFEQARSEIYIYDLAVAEPWRRRSAATALITELRRIARRRGAWMIFVQGDYGDDPALALYDKLGMREEVLHFDIAP